MDLKNGERSRRRVRDLVTQLAFEGRSENEIRRARISMMARSDLLHARAGYRSARPVTATLQIQLATHGRLIQSGQYRKSTAGSQRWTLPSLCRGRPVAQTQQAGLHANGHLWLWLSNYGEAHSSTGPLRDPAGPTTRATGRAARFIHGVDRVSDRDFVQMPREILIRRVKRRMLAKAPRRVLHPSIDDSTSGVRIRTTASRERSSLT